MSDWMRNVDVGALSFGLLVGRLLGLSGLSNLSVETTVLAVAVLGALATLAVRRRQPVVAAH